MVHNAYESIKSFMNLYSKTSIACNRHIITLYSPGVIFI